VLLQLVFSNWFSCGREELRCCWLFVIAVGCCCCPIPDLDHYLQCVVLRVVVPAIKYESQQKWLCWPPLSTKIFQLKFHNSMPISFFLSLCRAALIHYYYCCCCYFILLYQETRQWIKQCIIIKWILYRFDMIIGIIYFWVNSKSNISSNDYMHLLLLVLLPII